MTNHASIRPSSGGRFSELVQTLGLAVLYFLIARVSLFFVIHPEGLSVIWPAGGLMIAVLLMIPRRRWPWMLTCVFVANIFANMTGGNSVSISFGLAFANILECAVSAFLLIRFVSPMLSMSRFRDVLGLMLMGSGLGAALSALLSAAVLSIGLGARYSDVWLVWWVSDGISILVVTPVVLNLATISGAMKRVTWPRAVEAVVLCATIAVLTRNIFSQNFLSDNLVNQKYVLMPLLAWAAFRFKPLGTSLILFILSAISVTSVVQSFGPFAGHMGSVKEHVFYLQLFLSIACSTSLLLAATIAEREETQREVRDSEARYRVLFETSVDGILIADIQKRQFKYANPAICRMLGYSEAELKTMRVTQIHPKEASPKVEAILDAKVRGEAPVMAGIPCLRKDGSILYADINMVTNLIDGEPCMVGLFRDITERRQTEEALCESEEKLRLMFETSPIGMAMCEMNGTLVQTNQAYLNIIGYTQEETLKLSYWDLTPKEYGSQEALQLRLMEETGKYGPYEKEYIRKTGERVPVLLNGMIVVGADSVKRIWSLVEDITERKAAQDRLKKEKTFADSMINSLPGIFYLFDVNGRFLRWNQNFEAVTGFTAKEIAAMHPQDFFEGEEKNTIAQKIQEAFRKGHATAEAHLVTKSGKRIFYFFNGIRFASDDQYYITGMGIDLTERKKVEKELETQNRLLRTLIDNIPDSIYVKDAEGRKILTNRSDLNFMGAASEAEVLGKTDAEVYPKYLADLYSGSVCLDHF